MNNFELFILFLWFLIHSLIVKACNITEFTMNCSASKLTDCPKPNINITHLILDDNQLNTLLSENCKQWSHLEYLSVQNNILNELLDFQKFVDLQILQLHNNQISEFQISSKSLMDIDLSRNNINEISPSCSLPQLSKLIMSYNQIDVINFNFLIKSLYGSTFLMELNVEHNIIETLPINLMNFAAINIKLFNLSNNRMKVINFENFHKFFNPLCKIDFSANQINNWTNNNGISFETLILSHNNLSRISGNQLEKLYNLKVIDLSDNPLFCLCNESATFINWIQQHYSIIIQKSKTTCKYPPNQLLINITCRDITTTTIFPITMVTIINYSVLPKNNFHWWKLTIGLSMIGVFILLVGILLWKCQRFHGYSALNPSDEFTKFSFICDCLSLKTMLFGRWRTQSTVNSHNQPSNIIGSDENLQSNDSLVIICSSRDTEWVKSEIFSTLRIKNEIIDFKCQSIPDTDFLLIVVNDNECLQDEVLINNVQMALELKNRSEIRILIKKMPNFDKLLKSNCLTDFVRHMMFDKCYFNYDSNNESNCIDSLKLWMDLMV